MVTNSTNNCLFISSSFLARRRAAAKRKKLKSLGKSKSTDTEEEDADEDCGDDGECETNCKKSKKIVLVLFVYLRIDELEKTQERNLFIEKSKLNRKFLTYRCIKSVYICIIFFFLFFHKIHYVFCSSKIKPPKNSYF